jgi:hypothetical protein
MRVGFPVYHLVDLLDLAGPFEMLSWAGCDLTTTAKHTGRVSGEAQPQDYRLGQLLLSRSCQQILPGGGTTYSAAAPPVTLRQAQGTGNGNREVS